MTPLCAGQTHVYRANPSTSPSTSSGQHSGGAAARCDCGAQANNPPMSGYTFPNYTPNPHHPRYVPPTVAPTIPASVKAKAIEAGASHLSADGTKAFVIRMGQCHQANWSQEDSCFLSWWAMGGDMLPCGVVPLE